MYQSFIPPERTLMGPGPSQVSQRVLDASARPTIGHLDPSFVGLMDEIKALLQYAFRTENFMTMPVSAPGSAGMEMCFANLIEPGDKVLVCINGVFGGRMLENIERCQGEAITLEQTWGEPVDPQHVEALLNQHDDIKIVAFVHAETSTGALSDAAEITRIAHEHDALVIVDAVTSLAGVPLLCDEWALDAVYSGSQKCMSCLPGLSPVTFSQKALDKISNRTSKVQSWFLDISLIMGYWGSGGGGRSYHHTAPINALYALHEALVMLQEEGLENSWKRHLDNHLLLKEGLESMGLEFIVQEAYRLPQLNAVSIPDGVDDAAIRTRLLDEYSIEIGGGLGPMAGKIWRIGLMGHTSTRENVVRLVDVLKTVLG